MTLQTYEVTRGYDDVMTTHQAKNRRIVAEEHGAGAEWCTHTGRGDWLTVIALPGKRRALAPHRSCDAGRCLLHPSRATMVS
jgi:hypothetical protein